jgi:alpha-1,2-mannosyltransferase
MWEGSETRFDARHRPVALQILTFTSAGFLTLYAVSLSRQRQVDFQVYRMGGLHVLGSGLYSSSLHAPTGNLLLFTYTPLAAILFSPFSYLPTGVGQAVWDVINVVALTALIAVSSAAARRRPLVRSDWHLALIALTPTGLLLWPVRYDLWLGQMNIVLALMILTDLTIGVSWRGRRPPRGVLVGIAAAIKLTPLVFILFLLITRQWRAARNAALTFTAATGAMMAVAPRSSWNYFTKYVFDVRRIGNSSSVNNQTISAALVRAGFVQSHLVLDLTVVTVLCAGVTLAAVAFQRSSEFLGVLLCAATGLLVSPISWEHHYVWCVPLLFWLVLGKDRPRRGVMWAAIAGIVFMVMPPSLSGGHNVIGYMRENAYVLATIALLILGGAMLWTRARASYTAANNLPIVGLLRDLGAHDVRTVPDFESPRLSDDT